MMFMSTRNNDPRLEINKYILKNIATEWHKITSSYLFTRMFLNLQLFNYTTMCNKRLIYLKYLKIETAVNGVQFK
jgi:ribosomal protein L33